MSLRWQPHTHTPNVMMDNKLFFSFAFASIFLLTQIWDGVLTFMGNYYGGKGE